MRFTDQLDRTIELPAAPRRIISLVPSQTELLADLGLDEEVVGITKFCTHPEAWYRSKVRVGGTKQYHYDRIEALKPDLIIANKEENDREAMQLLLERYPVWVSQVVGLPSALEMIRAVGQLVDRADKAETLASEIDAGFNGLPVFPSLRAVYLIWRKPYMTVGGDTFIHKMMARAGFFNLFGVHTRYPEVDPAQLARLAPDVLLLSSEPFPFKERHVEELREICPQTVIRLVDGALFSWYGSRLLFAPGYFRKLRGEFSSPLVL